MSKLRLRELLEERGISPAEFAHSMRMRNASSLPLDGEYEPSIDTMRKYADRLGCKIWELFYDCGVSENQRERNVSPDDVSFSCPNCGAELRLKMSLTKV